MKVTLLLSLLLFCVVSSATAQDCLIGVYGDPAGTMFGAIPDHNDVMSIYVVMHVESTVAAAAYSVFIGGLNYEVFLIERRSGPSGIGLAIDEPTGTNVALAECVVGFGDNWVLIDEYRLQALSSFREASVTIDANSSQNPKLPVYVTCNDLIRECEPGPSICMGAWCFISAEQRSFSAIKSLYRKD